MPKVMNTRPKAIATTPYTHPNLAHSSSYHVSPTTASASQHAEEERMEYSKTALLTLVLSSSKLDWAVIGKGIGKTKSQTYDVWRKSIHPALINNKPWSSGVGAMGNEVRIKIVVAVLKSVKPDFARIAENFAGKSKTQLCDAWRKSIVPRLMKGEMVE